MCFRLDSLSDAERTVDSINLKILPRLGLCELYLGLEFQLRHNCGSQNTELAKVDFDKLLIDSASTAASMKVQRNNI
jgi:hypothetical protein